MSDPIVVEVGMFPRLMLWLLVLWAAVQLGGGLYEKRVVLPLWAHDLTPDTLGDRLAASGHTASATRFWPFVSPAVFLLATINALLAYREVSPARPWWLAAAVGLILMSVATYGYFVPMMLSFMHRAHTYTQDELTRAVGWWLGLSDLRMLIAVPSLLAALKALTLLGGRPGWQL